MGLAILSFGANAMGGVKVPAASSPGDSAIAPQVSQGLYRGMPVTYVVSTTFSSKTKLTASISMADSAMQGTASVTVVNAAPGGGTSNVKVFTINP